MLNWTDLKPGLYQLTTPDLVRKIQYPIEVQEDLDTYPGQSGWCHLTGDALRRMKGALGIALVSNVVRDDDLGITVAVSRGAMLRPDGMLEVYEQSRDYNLHAKLFAAGLKEVRELRKQAAEKGGAADSWQEKETVALARRPTEDAALSLVHALPPIIQAKVMEAQLEIREHRRALTCSKAENRILRELVREAGGRTRFRKGFKKTTVTFTRAFLKAILTVEQTAHLTDHLYPIEKAADDRLKDVAAPTTGKAVEEAESREATVDDSESPSDVDAREAEEVVTEEGAGADKEVIDAEFEERQPSPDDRPPTEEAAPADGPWGASFEEPEGTTPPTSAPPAEPTATTPATPAKASEPNGHAPAREEAASPAPAGAPASEWPGAPAEEPEAVKCGGCTAILSSDDLKFAEQGFAKTAFGGRKLCLTCRTAAARGDRTDLLGGGESK